MSIYLYGIRPRKDHRGVNLISDALPFGRLWYGEQNAIRQRNQLRRFVVRADEKLTAFVELI